MIINTLEKSNLYIIISHLSSARNFEELNVGESSEWKLDK